MLNPVKAVTRHHLSVSGTICAVNEALADAPEQLNPIPTGAWIIKILEGIRRHRGMTLMVRIVPRRIMGSYVPTAAEQEENITCCHQGW